MPDRTGAKLVAAAGAAALSLLGAAPASAAPAAAVTAYAPYVYLAPGEAYAPMSAGTFVTKASLSWAHDSGCPDAGIASAGKIDAAKLGGGGYQHQIADAICAEHGTQYPSDALTRPRQGDKGSVPTGEGFFLNFPNTERAGQGTSAPVYYEYSAHNYVTYWFFYAFNDAPAPIDSFDHEGDWERVSVRLDAQDDPVTVAYYEHSGYCTLPWSQAAKNNGHPVAYSAIGTHATYWKAGTFPTAGGLAKDTTGAGAAWTTYGNLADVRAQGWYGFGGAWGEVGDVEDSTGPLGPSSFKAPAPANWSVPCV